MTHVPGPWREHGTAVYADTPQPVDHSHYRGFDRPEGDRGYLIAESIPHAPTRRLIAAAPDLFLAAKGALFVLRLVYQREPGTNEAGSIQMLEQAIEKAGGAP